MFLAKPSPVTTHNEMLVLLRKIEEPELEVGDWAKYVDDKGLIIGMFEIRDEHGASLTGCAEIRKATGEVWQKIEGVWHKK